MQNCFQPSEGETLSGKSDEFSRDINPNYMSAALYEWDDVLSSTASEVNPRLASNLAPAARRNARGGTRCRSTELNSVYRRLLQMTLEKLQFLERQISQVDQERTSLLSQHVDAVRRLAEVPGLGVDPVRQILAEVEAYGTDISFGETASSWAGACSGDKQSAEVSPSRSSPKGNRHMRRILNQRARAAVKAKGSIFAIVYGRWLPRLGHKQTVGAIAHRLCRRIWMILHRGVRFENAVRRYAKGRGKHPLRE